MGDPDPIYEFFTDVEVLKSREPEYFICNKPIPIVMGAYNLPYATGKEDDLPSGTIEELPDDDDGSLKIEQKPTCLPISLDGAETSVSFKAAAAVSVASSSKAAGEKPVQKNAVSLLQEGSMRHYDRVAPKYEDDDMPVPAGTFAVRCEVREMKAVGTGLSKKAAKQEAAREILKLVIKKGRHKDFNLGETEEEAYAYLDRLAKDEAVYEPVNSETAVTVRHENYIGKLNDCCQVRRWFAARYDFSSEGPPNDCTFIAECRLGDYETTGEGKTKKIAKAVAAERMWRLIDSSSKDQLEEHGLITENSEVAEGEEQNSPECVAKEKTSEVVSKEKVAIEVRGHKPNCEGDSCTGDDNHIVILENAVQNLAVDQVSEPVVDEEKPAEA